MAIRGQNLNLSQQFVRFQNSAKKPSTNSKFRQAFASSCLEIEKITWTVGGAPHVWEDMKKQVAYLEDVSVVEVLENGDA